ncbi:hypothetical protein DFQ28_003874 [Apophysomyces sp. BC1034]|nr:hypothetical protein DFQ29_009140 [Apophysomyces sp. BC1021]KAG0170745.1 hypothetical protein DFQ29_009141 [Apophysomyces sp. BC1021]KAG0172357.1 hypothetical protein DFQ30_010591 [Apophysomyces sp. BC1015]KAG0193701.1 hypothetical protein DFQ28_003874 [Apophysomyces sp. BC1034]
MSLKKVAKRGGAAKSKNVAKKGKSDPKASVKKSNKASAKKKDINDQFPEYLPVPETVEEENVAISDDDLEFFAGNEDFQNFLQSMDSKELTRNTKKAKKPTVKSARAPVPEPEALSSSEDELDYDFENQALDSDSEDNLDNLDDLEDLDDLENIAMLESSDEEEKMDNKKKSPVKRKSANESDEEMDYEKAPRKVTAEWTRKDYHTKLPIKLPGGKIAQKEEQELADSEEEEAAIADEQEAVVEQEIEEDETAAAEESEPVIKLSKKEYILSKKEELAQVASDIQEDPEENIDRLKTLRNIGKDDLATVKKLSLLTQLAVYKDIIPGYRIRALTDKEEGVQVSKDVKKLREFEKSLLRNYELYLKDLDGLLTKKMTEEDQSMALVAARCLCELLTTKIHFNFRLNIMASVVARMSTLKWNEIADLCCKSIIVVLENDESGRASLDALRMITRMIKSKGYAVHENVVNSFLYLRLKDEMVPVAHQSEETDSKGKKRKRESKPFLTKKARKALKETKLIEKEFQEAEAVVSKEEKDKNHTETLKLLFAFYFRIIKKQSNSSLLPAVLQGLARFAHLINVDFFNDLLDALKEVMRGIEDSYETSRKNANTRKRLLCIITAFQLLSGQGEALNYDLKEFYQDIYSILLKTTFHTSLEDKPDAQHDSESDLLVRGLELMFLKKRQMPIDRMAAFAKRFSLTALHMPSKTVVQCLNLVQRLVQKDHRLDALLQSEDRAASGVYLPLLEDPELCNPFGTNLYELFLYQNHYDPKVRALAQALQQPPSA